jgi:hypothetical protein
MNIYSSFSMLEPIYMPKSHKTQPSFSVHEFIQLKSQDISQLSHA